MKNDLAQFLSEGTLLCTDSVTWGNGTLPLEVAYYRSFKNPPGEYISSVRAVVFQGSSVLVVREPGWHLYILPGGRVESGENLLQTLDRELLEETGWTIHDPQIIGFMYLHHLAAKPNNYPYPFPDIIWPVFTAEAGDFNPEARIPDKWVAESGFKPIDEAKKLPLEKGQLMLLRAAMSTRQAGV
jgi:8-oxo-dGTP diphosphatase